MQEYVSNALVLDCAPHQEADRRIFLFTETFGKIIARAKSIRKITSKLSGHLQPGNIVRARFVEQKGVQIVDALKESQSNLLPEDLIAINELLPEGEPDSELWNLIISRNFSRPLLLKTLGWDPEGVRCEQCGRDINMVFHIKSQSFFCSSCASRAPRNKLLYL